MGYYVTIAQSTFKIPADNLNTATERMRQLSSQLWPRVQGIEDAWSILGYLGFDSKLSKDGDILITGYDDKTGYESDFLQSICDISTGYIVWRGGEGEVWGETYGGTKVITKYRSTEDYSDIVTLDKLPLKVYPYFTPPKKTIS